MCIRDRYQRRVHGNTGIYLNPDYQRFVQEFVKMWSPIPDSKSEERFEPKHSDTLQMIKDRQVTQQIISGILPEIEEEKVSDYQRVCRLAIFNAHDIAHKTSSSDSFISWMNIIETHMKVNSIFSVWFLKYIEENKKLLFGILFGVNFCKTARNLCQSYQDSFRKCGKNGGRVFILRREIPNAHEGSYCETRKYQMQIRCSTLDKSFD
eukprot:TRINITY_DN10787_c0_g1_i1.p1 TRINITY_DN10787_c0_g1~~TRINITY_DN10787_c0_g1_i1.p1  ORF type:complete len:208 (+),score=33.46 TRINITY_DN10787_c0_g1_i1:168-791(+)